MEERGNIVILPFVLFSELVCYITNFWKVKYDNLNNKD
jgi:hypothetical protein